MAAYQPPTVTELGSLEELTLHGGDLLDVGVHKTVATSGDVIHVSALGAPLLGIDAPVTGGSLSISVFTRSITSGS